MLPRPIELVPALAALAFVLLPACADDGTNNVAGGGGSTGTMVGNGGGPAVGGGADGGAQATGGASQSATFAEMCASPGVVFCDAFEGSWDATWIEDGGDVQIVDGAAVAGEGSSVVELSTYESTQSSKLLRTFPDADSIYIRFDVQYADDYDNSGGSHGLILGGSDAPPWGMLGTAGMKPNGSDFFVLNFEPVGEVGAGGELGFYAYFVNMEISGDGNYWGNQFTTTASQPALITPGQWQCAEYGLTLNDGDSDNGTASFWVDGAPQGTFEGFTWRTSDALRLSTFALDSYNHMNNGPIPATQPNRVRYDNLVISSEPVGCLSN